VSSLALASPAAASLGHGSGGAGDRHRAHKDHGDRLHKSHKSDAAGADGGVVEPGKLVGGKVVKLGWWARATQPPPETGLLAPPSVPAPAAPKGSLPVAQVAGEPERIGALQISLDGKADGVVDSVVVAFKEVADPTANPNSAAGTVYACPVTEFWVGAENGAWETKPSYDCTAGSAQGVRDATGVWTFDLTSIAADWLASSSKLPPAVVFVSSTAAEGEAPAADPAAGSPESFQVALDAGPGLGLLAKTSPPSTSDDGGDGGGDDSPADSGSDEPSAAGGGTSGSGSSGSGTSSGTAGTPQGGTTSPAATGQLPNTGLDTRVLIIAGAVLVMAGLGLRLRNAPERF